jgi:hypothetical protein
LSQEPAEPLACAVRADVENLRPFGSHKRNQRLGVDRDVFWLDLVTLGHKALGALLGFAVHARSRWRGRSSPQPPTMRAPQSTTDHCEKTGGAGRQQPPAFGQKGSQHVGFLFEEAPLQ